MGARFVGAVLGRVLGLIATVVPTAAASATACIAGHNTVVPPCTFDGGVLSLDSAPSAGLGLGHHTLALFSGPDITVTADVAGGYAPYNSNDLGTGTVTGSLTLTISTVSGLPLIDDVGFNLIDPVTTGTGSISWSVGALTGDQNTTSGELFFPAPLSSITETESMALNSGVSGDATLTGTAISVSLVPEPSSLALVAAAFMGFSAIWRRFAQRVPA